MATGDMTGLRALVQGASRGLGATLAEQLLERGAQVFATARAPAESEALLALERGGVVALPLDVTDPASIAAAVARVGEQVDGLDLVLNVAGVLNGAGRPPERRLEHVDARAMAEAFAINAIGPILMARETCDLLAHGGPAVFASLSARVGSISDNRKGGWYSVRASKAAQNQLIKTLSIELARRAPNVTCVALHPGTVDTDMSRPYQDGLPADQLFSRERAARQLLDIIAGLGPADSGRFIAWDGAPIPW